MKNAHKKWPKKWIDAIEKSLSLKKFHHDNDATFILGALESVGAIRDIPSPREWYACPICMAFICLKEEDNSMGSVRVKHISSDHEVEAILMREVLE